jgi:hypothetical protein
LCGVLGGVWRWRGPVSRKTLGQGNHWRGTFIREV